MIEKYTKEYSIRTEFEFFEKRIERSDYPEILHSIITGYLLSQGDIVSAINGFFYLNDNVSEVRIYVNEELTMKFRNPEVK